MIVNHRHKFIFYHVPKAAGSSVRTAIGDVAGSCRPRGLGTRHSTPDEFLQSVGLISRWRYRRYFSFCFIRNPWERFGSAHNYNVKGGGPLPADVNDAAKMLADGVDIVVKRRSFIPQVKFTKGVSFVGRFENLDVDFGSVCKTIGQSLSLPRLNVSSETTSYLDTFTPRTIDIITRYYAEDIAAFGYRLPT